MTTFLSDIILNNENDIQFKNSAGSNAGKISQTGNDLVLSNDQGDILLGDGASDVYIGDGTNSVDILFEQSGSIKADDNASGVTITLGSNNTNIAFGGAVSFGGGVTAFSAASANTVDLGASATPFLNVYAAHHVGGNSINYATSRGWVEDSVPLSETQVGEFGGNFVKNGDVDENAVVRGQDCFNNKALLWKAIAHDTDDDADGGWNKNITIPANNDIGYLSYVYFMADFTADSATQGGNRDGTVYLGCGTTSGQTLNLNGTNNTNPYFVSQSLFTINNGSPAVANRWYLMVGVIQPYNDETTGTDTISGVYDVETGEKVLSGAEFKMGNNTTTQMHRTYLYYDESGDAGENVYFWNPGFHAIDGSEPKLQDLLKRQTIANTVKVGRDGHNLIDFTTDNQIDFRVADGNRLRLTQTALAPITTDTVSLGTSSLNFSDLFLDSGGVVNFDNGDVTLTHSSDKLKVEGGYFGVGGAPSYNFHVIGTGWAGQGLAVETTDTSKGAVISLVSDRNFQVASRGGTFDIRDVTGSLDDRRFHINSSGNATFSHNVTLPGFVLDGNTITGIDDSDEFTDDDAHIMTSAAINDRFYVPGSTLSAGTINFTGELNFTGNGAKYIDVFTLENSNDFTIRHHTETNNQFENAFRSTANGATYLYHNGNTKLTTKSDGVDITGELQCDTLDVEGNGEANRMTLNGTSFPQLFLINGSGNDQTLQLGVAGGSAYLKKSDATGQVLFRNSNNTDLMTIGMGDSGQVTVLNELQAGSLDINGNADISGSLTLGQALAVGDGGTGVTSNTIWLNANSFANFTSSSADWDTITTRGLYRLTGATNNPFSSSHATGLTLTETSGNYGFQLFSKGSDDNTTEIAYRYRSDTWENWQYLVTKTYGDGRYLLDSEVTNLAQVKAFDSSDYATAAQGTLATNALPKAGGTMSGNLVFNNNTELRWKDSGATERTILELTSADDLYIGGSHSGSLIFVGGGAYTERMRIDDSGGILLSNTLNVGVDDTGYDVKFYGATTSRFLHWDESEDYLLYRDNVKGVFGNSADLKVYHDSNNSYIENNGGNLYIMQRTDDGDMSFQCDAGGGGDAEYFRLDGGTETVEVAKATNFASTVSIANDTTITNGLYVNHNDGIQIAETGNASTSRTFLTSFTGGGNSRMKIKGGNFIHSLRLETSKNDFQYADFNSSYNGSDTTLNLHKSNSDTTGTDATTTISTGASTFAGSIACTTLIPSSHIYLGATKYLYFDGGGNTHMRESSADTLQITTGGTLALTLDSSQNATFAGDIAVSGTVDGVDIATRDGVLTSTTTTANAALPKTGGTMTGAITLPASNPTNANHATRKAYVDAQVLARKESFILACSDETNDLSASSGTPKVTFRMPYAFTLTDVRATVSTAPVGSTIIVDVKKGGSTIFSTKVSIDANAESSFEATTPRVFAAAASEVSFNEDEEVTIFLDQVGSSTAGKGLKVMLIGQQ